ncbi:MAG: propanediol utilization protein [Erysipelotrichaceae bacterium]|nr:propanediol utilization protein [Erysipelotrichaceae bacterium]
MAQVEAMLSNHHVHLTPENCQALFGYPELTVKKDMGSEFVANETVTLKGPKGKIENVRVLGGKGHKHTQVELFASDAVKLGVDAPVRDSGELEDAAQLTIIGPAGEITEEHCAIIAARHIHMGKALMDQLGIKDHDLVSVKAGGPRGLIFNNVIIRAAGNSAYGQLHLDMEEGNAAGIKNHDMVEVIVPNMV